MRIARRPGTDASHLTCPGSQKGLVWYGVPHLRLVNISAVAGAACQFCSSIPSRSGFCSFLRLAATRFFTEASLPLAHRVGYTLHPTQLRPDARDIQEAFSHTWQAGSPEHTLIRRLDLPRLASVRES